MNCIKQVVVFLQIFITLNLRVSIYTLYSAKIFVNAKSQSSEFSRSDWLGPLKDNFCNFFQEFQEEKYSVLNLGILHVYHFSKKNNCHIHVVYVIWNIIFFV